MIPATFDMMMPVAMPFAANATGAARVALRWFRHAPDDLLQVHQPYVRWFTDGG